MTVGLKKMKDTLVVALFAAFLALPALAEPADLTPLEERPLLHEHPNRHRVAPIPPPRSVPVPPHEKPKLAEPPTPATEKYRGSSPSGNSGGTGSGLGNSGSPPPGGRLSPLN